MKTNKNRLRLLRGRRRGSVSVLVAFLMIPLLGFVALCIDIGWIATTKSRLQSAADAAAAAGGRQLVDNYATYSLPGQTQGASLIAEAEAEASAYSTSFCGYNGAGGVTSLGLPAGDIVFGFTDANSNFTAGGSGYPNTIQVTVRRDSSANGRLPFFFAPAIGHKDTGLTSSSSMTVYTGLISAFGPVSQVPGPKGQGKGVPSGNSGKDSWNDVTKCGLLPVAFDVNHWNSFFTTGASPDGSIETDAEGFPTIQVYPSPRQSPGNFGQLCIGEWTNSDSEFEDWILNGPSNADLQYLANNGAFPVSQSAPKAWKGTPGLRTTLSSAFTQIIGQPRVLPLFEPKTLVPYQAASGSGSNTTYKIVGFVGVTVTSVSGSGNNLDIRVRPCAVLDPAAVFDPDTLFPAGAEPSTQLKTFTFTTPKRTK